MRRVMHVALLASVLLTAGCAVGASQADRPPAQASLRTTQVYATGMT